MLKPGQRRWKGRPKGNAPTRQREKTAKRGKKKKKGGQVGAAAIIPGFKLCWEMGSGVD